MPRSASGVYTLPIPPFTANTVIRSADVNSDFSDVATALTQSLATTGVSSMTGPIKAAAGTALVPSYSYAAATGTGWFLSGTNESTYVTPTGTLAIFGASTTVTWSGKAYFSADIDVTGSASVGSNLSVGGSLSTTGNTNLRTNVIVATTSVNITQKISLLKITDPASAAASNAFIYVKSAGPNSYAAPFVENENGQISPLLFQGGQCQLTKSGASLLLSPFGGNLLTVDGVPCRIPDAGVSLAASNSAATFVYIYALAINGAVTSLEMSTTVPALQVGSGVQQKTGDSTRTLVGAAYTDAGGAWADTNGKLWVISYFNRRTKVSKTTITTSLNTSTVTYLEVDTALRNNYISWLDETVIFNSKLVYQAPAASQVFSQVVVDAATSLDSGYGTASGPSIAGVMNNYTFTVGATENATHFGSIYVRNITASVIICSVGSTSKESSALYVQIRG